MGEKKKDGLVLNQEGLCPQEAISNAWRHLRGATAVLLVDSSEVVKYPVIHTIAPHSRQFYSSERQAVRRLRNPSLGCFRSLR